MACRPHYSDESCEGCVEASPGTCPSCGTDRPVCGECGYWLRLSPAEARDLAARLVASADKADDAADTTAFNAAVREGV